MEQRPSDNINRIPPTGQYQVYNISQATPTGQHPTYNTQQTTRTRLHPPDNTQGTKPTMTYKQTKMTRQHQQNNSEQTTSTRQYQPDNTNWTTPTRNQPQTKHIVWFDILGVRTPYLQSGGDEYFQMILDKGFEYDCSAPSQLFGYQNLAYGRWPYTYDYYRLFLKILIHDFKVKPKSNNWVDLHSTNLCNLISKETEVLSFLDFFPRASSF